MFGQSRQTATLVPGRSGITSAPAESHRSRHLHNSPDCGIMQTDETNVPSLVCLGAWFSRPGFSLFCFANRLYTSPPPTPRASRVRSLKNTCLRDRRLRLRCNFCASCHCHQAASSVGSATTGGRLCMLATPHLRSCTMPRLLSHHLDNRHQPATTARSLHCTTIVTIAQTRRLILPP